MVPNSAQLHLVLELLMPQAFSAHGISEWIGNDSFGFSLMAFICLVLCSIFSRDGWRRDNASWETSCKLLGLGANDRLEDLNMRHEAVRGGSDGGEFGMFGTNALLAVHGEVNALARPHLCEENVRIHWADDVVWSREVFVLSARWDELHVLGINFDTLDLKGLGRVQETHR